MRNSDSMRAQPAPDAAGAPRRRAGDVRRDAARSLIAAGVEARAAAPWLRYSGTIAALLLVTAALWPLRAVMDLLNIGLIFLIVVIGATLLAGRRPGALAAVLGFALFDYFLIPPYLTFAVGALAHILALVVFLAVSGLLNWLIARTQEQAAEATRRAEDVARLYELSQAIAAARRPDDVLPAIAAQVCAVFGVAACWILLPDPDGGLTVGAAAPAGAAPPAAAEAALAARAFAAGADRSARAPLLAGAGGALALPLRAGGRAIGALAVTPPPRQGPLPASARLALATFADQAAVALDRLTLLREAERAEALARADELKSALLSAVSHDLRTPLASIIAAVTSLLEPDMRWSEATQREFLRDIHEEAERLNRLVGNLLDMSRIEAGVLRPEKSWYSIGEVIEGVVGRLEPRLAGRPIAVQIAPDLPLVLLDYSEIDEALTNLLENAEKYTPPGAPIAIAAARRAGEIAVTVRDGGPGVPEADLPRLFDRFYRGDTHGDSRGLPHGAGLGLAICKGLIAAHGGQMWAANRPEGGLEVGFTLPAPPPAPAAIGSVAEAARHA